MSFSDAYVSSAVVRRILEGIPEGEREAFVKTLRESVSMFDSLVLDPSTLSMLNSSSEDENGVIPNQEGGRRPPRRR
jgi:hypothetical protein